MKNNKDHNAKMWKKTLLDLYPFIIYSNNISSLLCSSNWLNKLRINMTD